MKNITKTFIILLYLLLIGDMILNSESYNFSEQWLFFLNIVLLSIGFYNFIDNNKEDK